MTHALIQHNTLDDRRELHTLLGRLPPARRVAFVADCCARSVLPHSRVRPFVDPHTYALAERAVRDDAADTRLSLVLYQDLWLLSSNFDFDLSAALDRLEQVVKKESRWI